MATFSAASRVACRHGGSAELKAVGGLGFIWVAVKEVKRYCDKETLVLTTYPYSGN